MSMPQIIFLVVLVKATKTHFYYAMKNHDGTEDGFRKYLLNIIPHYQVNTSFLYELIHRSSIILFCSNRLLYISDKFHVQVHANTWLFPCMALQNMFKLLDIIHLENFQLSKHNSVISIFQGDHTNCFVESRCLMSDYVCTKKPLQDPHAIDAFRKAIMDTAIYTVKPSDYMTVGQLALSVVITV